MAKVREVELQAVDIRKHRPIHGKMYKSGEIFDGHDDFIRKRNSNQRAGAFDKEEKITSVIFDQ
jgi:hypothetical protein